jgi:hypothetical protein
MVLKVVMMSLTKKIRNHHRVVGMCKAH